MENFELNKPNSINQVKKNDSFSFDNVNIGSDEDEFNLKFIESLSEDEKDLYYSNTKTLFQLIPNMPRNDIREGFEKIFRNKDEIEINIPFSLTDIKRAGFESINNTLITKSISLHYDDNGIKKSVCFNLSLLVTCSANNMRTFLFKYFNQNMIKKVNNKAYKTEGVIEYRTVPVKFKITKEDFVNYLTLKQTFLCAIPFDTKDFEI